MRPLLRPLLPLALVGLLLGAASVPPLLAPAHASPLTVLLKAGKLAGKAGAKSAAGAGKLAKVGVAAKSAKIVGAAVAAEHVFAHLPASARRVSVFVTHTDDGLQAVVRGSDEVVGHADVGRFVGELDEMATIAPDAGVDLYLDASALDELAKIPVGPNTRVWVANPEGASWPIEDVLLRGEPTPVARVAPELAIRPIRGADVALDLMRLPSVLTDATVVLPEGAACAEELRAAATELGFAVGPEGEPVGDGALVVLGRDADLEAYAAEEGLDLVALGLADVCAVDDAGRLRVERELAAFTRPTTWQEVWAIAASADGSAVVDEVVPRAKAVVVTISAAGRELRTVIDTHLAADPAEESLADTLTDVLAGLACLGFLAVAAFPKLAWNLLRYRSPYAPEG